jgi:hypothetical protein
MQLTSADVTSDAQAYPIVRPSANSKDMYLVMLLNTLQISTVSAGGARCTAYNQ